MRSLSPSANPWLLSYLLQTGRRRPVDRGQPVHLLLCIADHYEPEHANATLEVARTRVQRWVERYPRLFSRFRDADGTPPRHTFFYPMEKYRPEFVDALANLCDQGYGEVEVQLHHEGETGDQLREMLLEYRRLLVQNHGMLCRRRADEEPLYGFVHGNWALDNSHPDRRCCGVNDELTILRETGCYGDFTMPSAPDQPTQARKINSIYYAQGRPGRTRSHDHGIDVGSGPPVADALLLIQGPLLLNWKRRKWGFLPRVENGCIQAGQPASAARIDHWLRARVQVPARPDWFFVKLHTHGAFEPNARVLLGEDMERFHEALAARAQENKHFHFHYVTAREMVNLAKAAEAGWQGSVDDARDFELVPWHGRSRPPVAQLSPCSAVGL